MKIWDWVCALLCCAWLLALGSIQTPRDALIAALQSQAASNWVQAIGSVIAIFVAVWVAWWQNRKDRESRAEEDRSERVRALKAVQMLCLVAVGMIRDAADATASSANGDAYRTYLVRGPDKASFDDLLSTLDRVALHDLPDPTATIAVHSLKRALCDSRDEIEAIRNRNDKRDYLPDAPLRDYLSRANAAYDMLESTVKQAERPSGQTAVVVA